MRRKRDLSESVEWQTAQGMYVHIRAAEYFQAGRFFPVCLPWMTAWPTCWTGGHTWFPLSKKMERLKKEAH